MERKQWLGVIVVSMIVGAPVFAEEPGDQGAKQGQAEQKPKSSIVTTPSADVAQTPAQSPPGLAKQGKTPQVAKQGKTPHVLAKKGKTPAVAKKGKTPWKHAEQTPQGHHAASSAGTGNKGVLTTPSSPHTNSGHGH